MTIAKLTGRLLVTAVLAWAVLGFTSAIAQGDRPGEGVSVQPGVASWTSALPKSWLMVELLEELGYTVAEPTLFPSNPVAYLSIAQGDIDYWPNGWFPVHDPQLPDNWEEAATVFEPLCPDCGLQGFLVDIPSIEEFEITSLDDFRRDDVKAAFDATGDGKADLFGCPPGWGCHEGIEDTLDTFDLRDDINHVTAEYAATFADALARIDAGEPTLYYTWMPSAWILALVPGEDVLWINAPGIRESEAEVVHGLETAVTDPVEMGWVAADIQVAANNDFLAANPAAEELSRQVRIPLDWISRVDAEIAEEGIGDEEIRARARDWMEENRELVDEWLEAARQAAN